MKLIDTGYLYSAPIDRCIQRIRNSCPYTYNPLNIQPADFAINSNLGEVDMVIFDSLLENTVKKDLGIE